MAVGQITPKLIDNFLPKTLYEELERMVNAAPLVYGAKSNSKTDPHGHMSWKPSHDEVENLADLRMLPTFAPLKSMYEHIEKQHLWPMVPIRTYANVHSYGMDGYMHQDSHRDGELTVITYICEDWNYDWAGETVCVSNDNQTWWSFVPRRNRALVIPSNMRHAARGISRGCPVARKTFMFKLRPNRGPIFEALSGCLVGLGALRLKHKHGTLHDHLVRVYQLLKDHGESNDICLAGGLHSVYGTTTYPDKLTSNRDFIRLAWGKEVEDIAWRFSQSADRQRRLNHYDWFRDDYYEHRMIEAANLIDQNNIDAYPNLKDTWNRRKEQSRKDMSNEIPNGVPALRS